MQEVVTFKFLNSQPLAENRESSRSCRLSGRSFRNLYFTFPPPSPDNLGSITPHTTLIVFLYAQLQRHDGESNSGDKWLLTWLMFIIQKDRSAKHPSLKDKPCTDICSKDTKLSMRKMIQLIVCKGTRVVGTNKPKSLTSIMFYRNQKVPRHFWTP